MSSALTAPKSKLWCRRLWGKSRKRAREAGIEFTITPEDLMRIWTGVCPVLQTELAFQKGIADCLPSLDRLDNSLGYIPGNVKIISWKVNKLKNDLSLEQLERLYRYSKGEI